MATSWGKEQDDKNKKGRHERLPGWELRSCRPTKESGPAIRCPDHSSSELSAAELAGVLEGPPAGFRSPCTIRRGAWQSQMRMVRRRRTRATRSGDSLAPRHSPSWRSGRDGLLPHELALLEADIRSALSVLWETDFIRHRRIGRRSERPSGMARAIPSHRKTPGVAGPRASVTARPTCCPRSSRRSGRRRAAGGRPWERPGGAVPREPDGRPRSCRDSTTA
jgi:hypothetical protein